MVNSRFKLRTTGDDLFPFAVYEKVWWGWRKADRYISYRSAVDGLDAFQRYEKTHLSA